MLPNDNVSMSVGQTWDQVISRSRAPSSCKQSRRDQDVSKLLTVPKLVKFLESLRRISSSTSTSTRKISKNTFECQVSSSTS